MNTNQCVQCDGIFESSGIQNYCPDCSGDLPAYVDNEPRPAMAGESSGIQTMAGEVDAALRVVATLIDDVDELAPSERAEVATHLNALFALKGKIAQRQN